MQAATVKTKTCSYCGAAIKYRMVPANRGQYWLICPVCQKPLESFSDSQRYEVLEYVHGGQTVTLIPINLTKTYTTSSFRYYFYLTLAADPAHVEVIKDPNTGEILERISGARALGYRETRLRVGPGIIKALKGLGYAYDSSILPTYVPGRFNWLRVKTAPFSWDLKGEGRLMEIPISVTPILRIPVGWWWFRKNFGFHICRIGFDVIWRRGMPVVCNVHPWELSQLPKRHRMPIHVKFNCGAASEAQIRMLIAHGKRAGARFLRMIDLAESISVDIEGSDFIDPF